MRFSESSRKRRGISELVGTMLTISITLLAGFAVFGYVNSQAIVSETQYGQAVGQTVQYLQERFVVAQFAFSSGSLTIYLYNNGNVNLQITEIELYNSTKTVMDLVYTDSGVSDLVNSGCTVSTASTVENPVLGTGSGSFSLATSSVLSLSLTLPTSSMNSACPTSWTWTSGSAYYAEITALYGNQVVYYQVD